MLLSQDGLFFLRKGACEFHNALFFYSLCYQIIGISILKLISKYIYSLLVLLFYTLWDLTYNIPNVLLTLMNFMQCPNGHTLCSSCKVRVHNHCPTCRQELGNIRCLALEKVAESLDLPCKYQSLGCSEIFPYYSKLKHEQLCRFRPYNCPYAGSECLVTGDIPMLVAHLKNDHKVDMHDGCTFNHRYVKSNPHEVENATWMLTVRYHFS